MQYAPLQSSSLLPTLKNNWVHVVPLGHEQYVDPSLVLPFSFAQRQDQKTALEGLRSVHCGRTCPTTACPLGVMHRSAPAGASPFASCP